MTFLNQTLIVEVKNITRELHHEESILKDQAIVKGINILEVSLEELPDVAHLLSKKDVIVAGTITFMKKVCSIAKLNLPHNNSYPACLFKYLKRSVTVGKTLAEVKYLIAKNGPLFVKPVNTKVFTGFVTSDQNDFRFAVADDNELVYYSEPVEFLEEWRAYVTFNRCVAIRKTTGEIAASDPAAIKFAHKLVEVMNLNNPNNLSGYAIDFGRLSTGELALVEVNDGYSLGAYGYLGSKYFDLIQARWNQIRDFK